MKKLIFKASFLALATLTIFSACKKDEVIEAEFVEKAEAKYTIRACVIYDKISGEAICYGTECTSSPGTNCRKPAKCSCL